MKSPFTNKNMIIVKEWRIMNIHEEKFKILFHTYKCEDTGLQFEDSIFAQLNYDQLINQYKLKHNQN
jgi:hypothetical protein